MRLSIRPNDSGYPNHHHLKAYDKRASVKLNGEPQFGVVTADSEAGVLVRLVQPLEWDKARQAFRDEVIHGRVEIEIVDEVML